MRRARKAAGGLALEEVGDPKKPWGEVDARRRGEGDFTEEISVLVTMDHASFARCTPSAAAARTVQPRASAARRHWSPCGTCRECDRHRAIEDRKAEKAFLPFLM